MTTADVDAYIARSTMWPDEMEALRPILLGAGLDEAIKWHKPCYGHDGSNIVIMQEMKDFLSLMFFKGALVDDTAGVLREQGPNSRSAKRIELTSVDQVDDLAEVIRGYVEQAIDIEDAGLVVEAAPEAALAPELQARLDTDPAFRSAFEALTPGRRREYDLQISAAKQASTRAARVEKYAPKILAGKGMRDR